MESEQELPRHSAPHDDTPLAPSEPLKYDPGPGVPPTAAAVAKNIALQDNPNRRLSSSVSIDDPDVRIAAQALGDLRADFIQSPAHKQTLSPPHAVANQRSGQHQQQQQQQQEEPLLSLLTTSHPLLSTAINGSLSAYSCSKSYSPRFKYGAEFVERHIGSPVASTVGSVGRRTGVEGGMRWWLGSRRPSQARQQEESAAEDGGEGAHKRRKVGESGHHHHHQHHHQDFDVERGIPVYSLPALPRYSERRPSEVSFAGSLPAYDDYDQRLPSYEAHGGATAAGSRHSHSDEQDASASSQSSTWQSRLMLSTSGLGVAMSEESLRSLKYCLTWLRWANVHLGKVIFSLKDLIERWDSTQQTHAAATTTQEEAGSSHQRPGTRTEPAKADPTTIPATANNNNNNNDNNNINNSNSPHSQQDALTRGIQALKDDVLHTLKKVVDVVSTYAGGALPENARLLVRRHLTSLPQRFHLASASASASKAGPPPNAGCCPPPSSSSPPPPPPSSSSSSFSASRQPASETVTSAYRMIVLATEGLDMMAQVSGVLDSTIASAEGWCDRLGRRRRSGDGDGNGEGEVETETETKEVALGSAGIENGIIERWDEKR